MKHPTSILFAICLFLSMGTVGNAQDQSDSTTPSTSPASVPRLVEFNGTANDDVGRAKSGTVGITFAIYKEQQGGEPLWLETQNVQADSKGSYTVLLGSTNPDGLPTDIFISNDARWLGVRVEGQEEQPRTLLVSAPYALKAGDAATIGGLPPSAFVRANPQSSASSDGTQAADKAVPEAVSAKTQSSLTNVQTSGGKTNSLPLWTSSTTIGNSVLSQAGDDVTLAGNLFIQKGTLNAAEGLILGQQGYFEANNPAYVLESYQLADSGNAISGISEGTNGEGVYGYGATGVLGQGIGVGIFGNVPATTGETRGVLGQISSTSGGAAAVEGVATGISGATTGVEGLNVSGTDLSTGVIGEATSTGGTVFGVEGLSKSSVGVGVYGFGQEQSSTGLVFQGCCAFGVWGDTGSADIFSAAIMGTADNARAMFLENNSTSVPTAFMQQDAAGQFALEAGGGTFGNSCTINTNGLENCPGGYTANASVDSGTRQVALYSMQSPQNWFEDFGTGQLSGGLGRVTLDSTFAQTVNLDSDYHVFLTPSGECRGLYVTNKTATGFDVHEIGGGQSNVSFDYRIVALRRGFENVRLADMTQQMKELSAPQPKPAKGHRLTVERPTLPIAAAKPTAPTVVTPR